MLPIIYLNVFVTFKCNTNLTDFSHITFSTKNSLKLLDIMGMINMPFELFFIFVITG